MPKLYNRIKQILFYLFLIVYVLLLAKILLFKEVSLFNLFDTNRMIYRSLNIIPFETISEYFLSPNLNFWISLLNVAGNIVIFIPLGSYLLIFKRDKRILISAALVCAVSLCVEILQYTLAIGRADIDDIILNTLGGLLGVLFYKLLYSLLKDENKTKTAVIFSFYITAACFGAYIFVLTYILGMKVKLL